MPISARLLDELLFELAEAEGALRLAQAALEAKCAERAAKHQRCAATKAAVDALTRRTFGAEG